MKDFYGYKVTECGKVYSQFGRKLSYHFCKKGYARVNLKIGDRKRGYLVHRIVSLCYIDNPKGLPQVNHKDGNKRNNSVDNLEWVSCQDNVKHSVETGLVPRGKGRPNAKLDDEQVLEIRRLRDCGANYYQLGKLFGIAYQTAHKICTMQTYTHI
jgi:hypothetical protein